MSEGRVWTSGDELVLEGASVPVPPTPFHGRRRERRILSEAMSTHGRVALQADQGARGVGLTSLAAKLVEEEAPQLCLLWDINTDGPHFAPVMHRWRRQLQMDHGEGEWKARIPSLMEALGQQEDPWIWFEDVSEPEHLRMVDSLVAQLPSNVRVLVTCHGPGVPEGCHRLSIGGLALVEAVGMVRQTFASTVPQNHAVKLAELTAGYPEALKWMAARNTHEGVLIGELNSYPLQEAHNEWMLEHLSGVGIHPRLFHIQYASAGEIAQQVLHSAATMTNHRVQLGDLMGISGLSHHDVKQGLARLVDLGLMRSAGEGIGRIPASVRMNVRQLLHTVGDLESYDRRHLLWFTRQAAEWSDEGDLEAIHHALPDLMAAVSYAHQTDAEEELVPLAEAMVHEEGGVLQLLGLEDDLQSLVSGASQSSQTLGLGASPALQAASQELQASQEAAGALRLVSTAQVDDEDEVFARQETLSEEVSGRLMQAESDLAQTRVWVDGGREDATDRPEAPVREALLRLERVGANAEQRFDYLLQGIELIFECVAFEQIDHLEHGFESEFTALSEAPFEAERAWSVLNDAISDAIFEVERMQALVDELVNPYEEVQGEIARLTHRIDGVAHRLSAADGEVAREFDAAQSALADAERRMEAVGALIASGRQDFAALGALRVQIHEGLALAREEVAQGAEALKRAQAHFAGSKVQSSAAAKIGESRKRIEEACDRSQRSSKRIHKGLSAFPEDPEVISLLGRVAQCEQKLRLGLEGVVARHGQALGPFEEAPWETYAQECEVLANEAGQVSLELLGMVSEADELLSVLRREGDERALRMLLETLEETSTNWSSRRSELEEKVLEAGEASAVRNLAVQQALGDMTRIWAEFDDRYARFIAAVEKVQASKAIDVARERNSAVSQAAAKLERGAEDVLNLVSEVYLAVRHAMAQELAGYTKTLSALIERGKHALSGSSSVVEDAKARCGQIDLPEASAAVKRIEQDHEEVLIAQHELESLKGRLAQQTDVASAQQLVDEGESKLKEVQDRAQRTDARMELVVAVEESWSELCTEAHARREHYQTQVDGFRTQIEALAERVKVEKAAWGEHTDAEFTASLDKLSLLEGRLKDRLGGYEDDVRHAETLDDPRELVQFCRSLESAHDAVLSDMDHIEAGLVETQHAYEAILRRERERLQFIEDTKERCRRGMKLLSSMDSPQELLTDLQEEPGELALAEVAIVRDALERAKASAEVLAGLRHQIAEVEHREALRRFEKAEKTVADIVESARVANQAAERALARAAEEAERKRLEALLELEMAREEGEAALETLEGLAAITALKAVASDAPAALQSEHATFHDDLTWVLNQLDEARSQFADRLTATDLASVHGASSRLSEIASDAVRRIGDLGARRETLRNDMLAFERTMIERLRTLLISESEALQAHEVWVTHEAFRSEQTLWDGWDDPELAEALGQLSLIVDEAQGWFGESAGLSDALHALTHRDPELATPESIQQHCALGTTLHEQFAERLTYAYERRAQLRETRFTELLKQCEESLFTMTTAQSDCDEALEGQRGRLTPYTEDPEIGAIQMRIEEAFREGRALIVEVEGLSQAFSEVQDARTLRRFSEDVQAALGRHTKMMQGVGQDLNAQLQRVKELDKEIILVCEAAGTLLQGDLIESFDLLHERFEAVSARQGGLSMSALGPAIVAISEDIEALRLQVREVTSLMDRISAASVAAEAQAHLELLKELSEACDQGVASIHLRVDGVADRLLGEEEDAKSLAMQQMFERWTEQDQCREVAQAARESVAGLCELWPEEPSFGRILIEVDAELELMAKASEEAEEINHRVRPEDSLQELEASVQRLNDLLLAQQARVEGLESRLVELAALEEQALASSIEQAKASVAEVSRKGENRLVELGQAVERSHEAWQGWTVARVHEGLVANAEVFGQLQAQWKDAATWGEQIAKVGSIQDLRALVQTFQSAGEAHEQACAHLHDELESMYAAKAEFWRLQRVEFDEKFKASIQVVDEVAFEFAMVEADPELSVEGLYGRPEDAAFETRLSELRNEAESLLLTSHGAARSLEGAAEPSAADFLYETLLSAEGRAVEIRQELHAAVAERKIALGVRREAKQHRETVIESLGEALQQTEFARDELELHIVASRADIATDQGEILEQHWGEILELEAQAQALEAQALESRDKLASALDPDEMVALAEEASGYAMEATKVAKEGSQRVEALVSIQIEMAGAAQERIDGQLAIRHALRSLVRCHERASHLYALAREATVHLGPEAHGELAMAKLALADLQEAMDSVQLAERRTREVSVGITELASRAELIAERGRQMLAIVVQSASGLIHQERAQAEASVIKKVGILQHLKEGASLVLKRIQRVQPKLQGRRRKAISWCEGWSEDEVQRSLQSVNDGISAALEQYELVNQLALELLKTTDVGEAERLSLLVNGNLEALRGATSHTKTLLNDLASVLVAAQQARQERREAAVAKREEAAALAVKLGELFDPEAVAKRAPLFERGLSLARRAGDKKALIEWLVDTIDLYMELGRTEEGAALCLEALEVSESLEGAPQRAQIQRRLARLWLSLGAPQKALEVTAQASEAMKRGGYLSVLLSILEGEARVVMGDHDEASQLIEAAYDRALALDEAGLQLQCLGLLTRNSTMAGHLEEAAEWAERYEQRATRVQDAKALALALARQCMVASRTGRHGEALDLGARALRLSRGLRDQGAHQILSVTVGHTLLAAGRPHRALMHFESALAWAEEAKDGALEASASGGREMALEAMSHADQMASSADARALSKRTLQRTRAGR